MQDLTHSADATTSRADELTARFDQVTALSSSVIAVPVCAIAMIGVPTATTSHVPTISDSTPAATDSIADEPDRPDEREP